MQAFVVKLGTAAKQVSRIMSRNVSMYLIDDGGMIVLAYSSVMSISMKCSSRGYLCKDGGQNKVRL